MESEKKEVKLQGMNLNKPCPFWGNKTCPEVMEDDGCKFLVEGTGVGEHKILGVPATTKIRSCMFDMIMGMLNNLSMMSAMSAMPKPPAMPHGPIKR